METFRIWYGARSRVCMGHSRLPCAQHQTTMSNAFGLITESILALGACPLASLAAESLASNDARRFDLPFLASGLSSRLDLVGSKDIKAPQVADISIDKQASTHSMHHVAQLHQTCEQIFGNADALKYEFIEDGEPECKHIFVILCFLYFSISGCSSIRTLSFLRQFLLWTCLKSSSAKEYQLLRFKTHNMVQFAFVIDHLQLLGLIFNLIRHRIVSAPFKWATSQAMHSVHYTSKRSIPILFDNAHLQTQK